jgi:hypothetical protein
MEGRCIDRDGRDAEAGDAGKSAAAVPGDDPFPEAPVPGTGAPWENREGAAAEAPPLFPCE